MMSKAKDGRQLLLKHLRVLAKFPGRYLKSQKDQMCEEEQAYRVEWPLKVFGQSFYGQGLAHSRGSTGNECQSMMEDQAPGSVLQKCYQPLALSLHKVVDHIVGCAGYVSLREGSDNLLLRGGDREIVERRWIPDNVRDIVDHKFHFVSLAHAPSCRAFRGRRLTPPLIAKAPPVNRLAADHQVAFAHGCCIKAIGLDFFCVGVREEENIGIVRRARPGQFVDMRPGVVRIDFAEVSHINHNATVHRNFDVFALLYVEGITAILDMILAHEGGELSTTPDKVFFHFLLVPMKLKWKRLKPVNSLGPLEFSDSQCRRHFAKHMPVKVQQAAFHVEVCNSSACRPLLARVIPAASWLFGVENGRVDLHIRLEQSPEQVVRDLAIFEKRCKTGRSRNVGSTDVLH